MTGLVLVDYKTRSYSGLRNSPLGLYSLTVLVSAQLSLYTPKELLKECSASPFGGDTHSQPKIVNL